MEGRRDERILRKEAVFHIEIVLRMDGRTGRIERKEGNREGRKDRKEGWKEG